MKQTTVEIPIKKLNKILRAYYTIGDFLECYIDPRSLYQKEFIEGMTVALTEVSHKQTKKVKNFSDIIS